MAQSRLKYTVDDYLRVSETSKERYELIDGELHVVPSPSFWHQNASSNLNDELKAFVRRRGLGSVVYAPLDVVLSPVDVFQPDILYISNERKGIITQKGLINGAPDLVVEILSPSNARNDLTIKRAKYEAHGVREYWIVDPERRTVQVLSLGDAGRFESAGIATSGEKAVSKLLEGFEVDVNGLFVE